jgi:hypothetical protein
LSPSDAPHRDQLPLEGYHIAALISLIFPSQRLLPIPFLEPPPPTTNPSPVTEDQEEKSSELRRLWQRRRGSGCWCRCAQIGWTARIRRRRPTTLTDVGVFGACRTGGKRVRPSSPGLSTSSPFPVSRPASTAALASDCSSYT